MKRLFFWIFVATALVLVACTGGGGEAQKPAAEPSITSFSGNLSQVVSGGKVVLSWVSVDAVSAVIQPGDIAVDLSGSLEVSPAADTTYTLVVTGAQGKTASASVSVTVVPLPDPDSEPVITSFSTDVSQVVSGGKVVLSWVSVDGVSAVMQPGNVAVDLSGSREVQPTGNTTYTLIVTGVKGDSVSASVSVTVVAPPDPSDPYADQAGVDPPDTIDGKDMTIRPVINFGEPDEDGFIEINVSGLLLPDGGMGILQAGGSLTADDFTVIEGDTVKGITVQKVGEGGQVAPADILFVLDTSSSMKPGLQSVLDNIKEFVSSLALSGLDVRVGAITFGDAFDVVYPFDPLKEPGLDQTYGISVMDREPPTTFDEADNPLGEERASFLLSAITEEEDYEAFIDYLTYEARADGHGGGDIPENSLGALEYAFDTAGFGWRDGAQRHFIVITDNCSHTADTYHIARITHPWIPSTFELVLPKLQGQAQVHVIEPSRGQMLCSFLDPRYSRKDHVDMKEFAGVDATGGVYVEWETDANYKLGTFDLTGSEITEAIGAGGYVITYRSSNSGPERTVRLVIDNGFDIRGEATISRTAD